MTTRTRLYFDLLDGVWDDIRGRLSGTFTTQEFQRLLEASAPDVWAPFVEKWGPGGKGSGNFYSPANVLNNYLKDKTRSGELLNLRFVPSAQGWGARVVNRWQFVVADDIPASEEDWEFTEGRKILRSHLFTERAAGVRKKLLRSRGRAGLFCDICETTGEHLSAGLRDALFEAHHSSAPMSNGERTTRKDDVALLCACCHRLLHRLVLVSGNWVMVSEAKALLKIQG
ncbi:HNH endonuclease [Agrobacterium bohemicum]|uniref:HNH domain-containing protein n=1 Tax=Agrobacterium bohemicum TaxID=2052828 RepID=A0A135P328_9HYPH|nr:hypothetical protein [Agrobacterium bohemicum]KXG85799.1 hypothetical protein ATO67_03955 [Agrobacterium bohemicum]